MLTRKQHDLLTFIIDRVQGDGVSPSFDEMKNALDLKSKSGIHRLITALEERGFIHRLPNRARALEVIKFPDGSPFDGGERSTGSNTDTDVSAAGVGINAGQADHGHQTAPYQAANDDYAHNMMNDGMMNAGSESRSVPVMGQIAAGTPISAIQDNSNTLIVPPDMLGMGEHYALQVKGDSMIEAGILDGDMVVIQKAQTCNPGEIVVALVDREEATLKHFYRKDGKIALEPANAAYETQYFEPHQIELQGKLVGLVRNYH